LKTKLKPSTFLFLQVGWDKTGLIVKPSIKDHKTWSTLRKPQPKINLEVQVEKWLSSDSPLSLTGNTISMINAAIIYVIKKLTLAGLQFVVGEAVNVIDVLANFLLKAARFTKETGEIVGSLLKRILKAMGKVVTDIKNITYIFIMMGDEVFSQCFASNSQNGRWLDSPKLIMSTYKAAAVRQK